MLLIDTTIRVVLLRNSIHTKKTIHTKRKCDLIVYVLFIDRIRLFASDLLIVTFKIIPLQNVAPSMCRSISAMLRVQALCLYQVGIRRDHMNPSMVRSRPLTCIMFIDQSRRLGALICPVVLATIFTRTQTQTHTNTHTHSCCSGFYQ